MAKLLRLSNWQIFHFLSFKSFCPYLTSEVEFVTLIEYEGVAYCLQVYIPESKSWKALYEAIELYDGYQYVPQIYQGTF